MLRSGIRVRVDGGGLDAILRCCSADSSALRLSMYAGIRIRKRRSYKAISPRLAIRIEVNAFVEAGFLVTAEACLARYAVMLTAWWEARPRRWGRTIEGPSMI